MIIKLGLFTIACLIGFILLATVIMISYLVSNAVEKYKEKGVTSDYEEMNAKATKLQSAYKSALLKSDVYALKIRMKTTA